MNEEKIKMLRDYFMSSPKGVPERVFRRFAESAETFICFKESDKYLLAAPLADVETKSLSYVVLHRTREDVPRWFSSMDTVLNYVTETCKANPLMITLVR